MADKKPEQLERTTSGVKLADTEILAILGKKQVLKRRFGFWTLFGFAVCELITWETILALFSQGFNNGGPAGLVFGFLIAWLSTLSVYTVIAELASIAPIASGQYYWVYMLAPTNYKKAFSYLVGWLTSLAWVATVATETMFAGTMIQGLLILRYPDYDSKPYQGTLFSWLVTVVGVFINVVIPDQLPRFEILILVLHVAGFIAILSALWATAPHGSASDVFLTAFNEGGWPTQGLSYCVGFLGNVATFVGADASVHMAEEVENAASSIPRVITISMIFNGLVGFTMMLTVLFCLGDAEKVLGTNTGFPFIQVFYDSVQNMNGAVTMVAVVLILTWACAIGITTTASRMTWAFARDRGTPFSRYLSKVAKYNSIPIIAVVVVCTLACLLSLIYIGSETAFNDVISLTITGFYGSYLVPSALLLYHRLKGNVGHGTNTAPMAPQHPTTTTASATDEEKSTTGNEIEIALPPLNWGPWYIPGWLGTLNNAYACVYMVFVIFWSVWPPETPVTASTMNYSVVVTGGVLIFAGLWYMVRARREYKGPIVDQEAASILRRAGLLEGEEVAVEEEVETKK
ncbi:amino acid/polyamine transporter I [Xylogone sp. PMI_703]|nr:amino acid/polyamine transporter I [Xylogone sp. PMI_703]